MGQIVPRRFNNSTSQCAYAANSTQDLTAQTWLTQFMWTSATGIMYVFGHCDSGARNGTRIQLVSGSNAIRFGADSTGTANAPYNSANITTFPGILYSFAATWDGTSLASSSIKVYISEGGAPLAISTGGGSANGTTALQSNTTGQPLVIGNRTGGGRTWSGDIHLLGCWNRILTLEELQKAQRLGAASVPIGLALDWHDGKDWGPNHLTCPTITALDYGVTSPFVAPTRKRRPRYFSGPVAVTLQYLYPIADIATNSWSPSTGATLYPMVGEAVKDYATYIYSPNNPTTQQFEVKVTAGNKPPAGSSLSVTISLRAMDQDTNFDIDLVENTTIKDSWTEFVAVADGDVDRTHVVASSIVDGMTDFTNIRIRGVARA